MNSIKLRLVNLKGTKNNNIYNFKVSKLNKDKYIIEIISLKEQIIQFKLNYKLMDKLTINYNNTVKNINYVIWNGLLINYNIDIDKPLILIFTPKDLCSEVNIWDLEIINSKLLHYLKWNKIYIINLKRRTDRKLKMIEKLKIANLNNYEFIEGIDGNNTKIKEEFNELKKDNLTKIVTHGHYGCLLSHIKVLELAKKNNYDNVLIIEDDVFFIDDFINKINNLKLPKFDIVYLGGIIPQIKCGLNGWIKTNDIMGAYSYIVNKSMYDILLSKLYLKNSYIDVIYIESIQNKYNVILLNDYIKTNLESSDTSGKNKKLIRNLNNINFL